MLNKDDLLTYLLLFWMPSWDMVPRAHHEDTCSSPYLFQVSSTKSSEAATQRCFYEKMFWKSTADLQENTHAEV